MFGFDLTVTSEYQGGGGCLLPSVLKTVTDSAALSSHQRHSLQRKIRCQVLSRVTLFICVDEQICMFNSWHYLSGYINWRSNKDCINCISLLIIDKSIIFYEFPCYLWTNMKEKKAKNWTDATKDITNVGFICAEVAPLTCFHDNTVGPQLMNISTSEFSRLRNVNGKMLL